MEMTKQEFLSKVDHSLLKPQLTREEIMEGLQFAKENHCALTRAIWIWQEKYLQVRT